MVAPAQGFRPWVKVDPDAWFDPAEYRGCRPRRRDPDLIVGHWTGGEAGARRADDDGPWVARVLRARKNLLGLPSPLSIHFVIGYDGTIWQLADIRKTTTLHASRVNERSVGIEVVNPGLSKFVREGSERGRDRISFRVHGEALEQVSFTHAQLEAWLRLVDALTTELGIPRRIPGDFKRNTKGRIVGGVDVSDRMLSRRLQREWSGVLEHLHVGVRKVKKDAGTQLARYLLVNGYKLDNLS